MESLAVMMENAAAEIESLRSKIESLFQIIDPIQDERDAIEAQMELMRDALKSVRDYGAASWDDWLIEKADKALAIPEGEATAKLKFWCRCSGAVCRRVGANSQFGNDIDAS